MYITDVLVDKLSPNNQQGLGVQYRAEEKERILSWLKRFEAWAFTSAPVVDVFTGETVADADNGYTDGKYTWYESEIYYFEKYNLKLRRDFIEHIVRGR